MRKEIKAIYFVMFNVWPKDASIGYTLGVGMGACYSITNEGENWKLFLVDDLLERI